MPERGQTARGRAEPRATTPFPMVVERGLSPGDAIAVTSFPQQLLTLRVQRCPCGGRLSLGVDQRLEAHGARMLERMEARCVRCDRMRPMWFDISAYHDDPAAHGRFDELVQLLREGVALMDQGAFAAARPRFEEIVAREPSFAPAWAKLGICAVATDNLPLARRAFTTAIGLCPMEATHHMLMSRLLERVGETDRARWHREVAEALDALVDDDEA
ncbi:MAG: tetratricopeptide repeat protein [Deltaproteobacteria bacterium]|nr:tetratricopeptide repeat protein [Deltaproteobacteria bacterium]